MLRVEEITSGCVAYLDGDALLADRRVVNGDHGKIGQRRPFVCVRVGERESEWMLLTSQENPKRIDMDAWKVPGSKHWMDTKQYLHDARKTFMGPNQAFADASAGEIEITEHPRPSISEEGMFRIFKEIKRYNSNW